MNNEKYHTMTFEVEFDQSKITLKIRKLFVSTQL